MRALLRVIATALPLVLLAAGAARAEPYLALGQGAPCILCHVNPTGGGLRNAYGNAFAQGQLAAWNPSVLPAWSGALADWLRLGSDLRASSTRSRVPGQPSVRDHGLDQWRLYVDLQPVPGIVGLYLDEQIRPGEPLRQESYLRLSTPDQRWYAKAGQFYLPFGWRLQDNSAFVRSLSGINMTAPDKGVELGLEAGPWSLQLAASNGPGNVGTISGNQRTLQGIYRQPNWRVGLGYAATRSSAGGRQGSVLFGGLRTGALVWLGELDLVADEGFPEGRRHLLAALGELDWRVTQGQNLKFTAELFDPDRAVSHDHKVRYSLVYELTPLPFVQLRAGWRRHLGIPQNDFDNRHSTFVEIHLFF